MGAYRLRGIFSKNLKDVLSRNSITQAELADMMGVSYSSVSAWCTGVKMPRMDKIEWIANRFGIQKSDLIEDRGDLNNVASGDFAKVQYAGPIAAHFNATPTELHEYWHVPPEWLGHRKPEDFFIALVDGNSMYPHYQDGDYILCLRCSDMEYSGRVGIMLLAGGEATLKKIEYKLGEDWVDLVPMNPEFITTRIEGADLEQCRVVGRVVRLIRKTDDI